MTKACRTISKIIYLFTKKLLRYSLNIVEPEKCHTTGLENVRRHGEVTVKPRAKIAHFRHGFNVYCANKDRTRINFQQLLMSILLMTNPDNIYIQCGGNLTF